MDLQNAKIVRRAAGRLMLAALAVLWMASCGEPDRPAAVADRALAHMLHLSEAIGQRVTGTPNEAKALDYVRQTFLAMGYEPAVQPFGFAEEGGGVVFSANVIAVLPGDSSREIIVGAHYDSVDVGRGFADNASGVGLLLALAGRLKNSRPPCTVRFIVFGAEEPGFIGSRFYVAGMSEAEIGQTVGMINLDTLACGDMIYACGGEGEAGWMRHRALDIAAQLGIDLKTNPGWNPHYPAGTAGDWSDHAPFRQAGIDYLYCEATNWEIGDLDGSLQTEKFGEIIHTPRDNFSFLARNFPGRVRGQLGDFARVLETFLLSVTAEDAAARIDARGKDEGDARPAVYLRRDGSVRRLPPETPGSPLRLRDER